MGKIAMELFHDNFQNFKRYNIPRAQLVIADIPYNIGENAYGSNPMAIFGQMLGLDYETKIKELTKELSKGRKNDRD